MKAGLLLFVVFAQSFLLLTAPPSIVHYRNQISKSGYSEDHRSNNVISGPYLSGNNFPGLAPAPCKEIDWSVWSAVGEKKAQGTISNQGVSISVLMNADFDLESTPQIWRSEEFKRFKGNIPTGSVARTTWSKTPGGKITVCFSQSVKEPVLLLASLGSYKERILTTISFSEPYHIVYNDGGMIANGNKSITGREGYALIKFPGDIKCVTIYSSSYENFTDLTWGIPVCPEGIPKPVVKGGEPEPAPKPIAALPKPEPVVAAAPKPTQKPAEPAPAPKPAVAAPEPEPSVAATPKPVQKPAEPVVVSVPKPLEKPAEPVLVSKSAVVVPKPEPVVASAPKPVEKPPVPAPKPMSAPKPEPVVAAAPKLVEKLKEPESSSEPIAVLLKPEAAASVPKAVAKPVAAATSALVKPVIAVAKPKPAIASNSRPTVRAAQSEMLTKLIVEEPKQDAEPVPVEKSEPVAVAALPVKTTAEPIAVKVDSPPIQPKPEPVAATVTKPTAVKPIVKKPESITSALPKPLNTSATAKPKQAQSNISQPKQKAPVPNLIAKSNLLRLEVSDYDGVDYDSVALKFNGRPLGPHSIQLQLSNRNGLPQSTYPVELQPGSNTLEIYALSEGLKPFTTVCLQIFYEGKPKKLYFTLRARESTIVEL